MLRIVLILLIVFLLLSMVRKILVRYRSASLSNKGRDLRHDRTKKDDNEISDAKFEEIK